MQNIDFWTRITSLFRSQISPVVLCMQNSLKRRCFQSRNHRWTLEPIETSKSDAGHAVLQAQNHRIISLYGSQTSHVVLCMQYSVISTRITCLFGSQPLSIFFCMQNSDYWSRITNLYVCWTSPVVLCKKNSVISTRITSLHGFQPSSVVLCIQNNDFWTRIQVSMGSSPHLWFCAFKTAPLGPENHVSVGPSPHLWFCAFKRATLGPELQVPMDPRRQLWFCACKTACLASELLVSMGSSPHLSFLVAKHRLLDQNNKSLWVPDITCRFVHAKQLQKAVFSIQKLQMRAGTSKSDARHTVLQAQNPKITNLYGSQTSPVI